MPSIAALGSIFFLLVAVSLPNTVSAQTEDHLKCYKVKDPLILKSPVPPAAKEWLRLTGSQFGEENCRVVGGFRLLCVPVTKEIITDPRGKLKTDKGPPLTFTPVPLSGITQEDQLCYKIRCEEKFPEPPNPSQDVVDQFADRTLEKLQPFLLCGPVRKCPSGDPVVVDISTGNMLEMPGDPDRVSWKLIASPAGTVNPNGPIATVISPNNAWATFPSAQWISANIECTKTVTFPEPDVCPAGLYSYELCWTQCGELTEPLSLQLLADNNAVVFLNDIRIVETPVGGFASPLAFSPVPQPGPSLRNCLRVDVTNFPFSQGGGSATGMALTGVLAGDVTILD